MFGDLTAIHNHYIQILLTTLLQAEAAIISFGLNCKLYVGPGSHMESPIPCVYTCMRVCACMCMQDSLHFDCSLPVFILVRPEIVACPELNLGCPDFKLASTLGMVMQLTIEVLKMCTLCPTQQGKDLWQPNTTSQLQDTTSTERYSTLCS